MTILGISNWTKASKLFDSVESKLQCGTKRQEVFERFVETLATHEGVDVARNIMKNYGKYAHFILSKLVT